MITLFSFLTGIRKYTSSKKSIIFLMMIVLVSSTTRTTTRGIIPNRTFPTAEVGKMVSTQMSTLHLNQPIVFDGYAVLTGNAVHEVWNISDPYRPALVKKITSAHSKGEAESHEVSLYQDGNGKFFMATISGKGFDIWDVTDVTNPVYVKAVVIPNVNYGDVDNGIWGLCWQGKYVYVGATNQGVYVVDVSNRQNPVIRAQVPMTQLGGVKSGPLFALGNLLVITSPKGNSGVATIDISDPLKPIVLDYVRAADNDSYFGGFYGKNAVVINPLRVYDVTTNPSDIKLVAQKETVKSEYVSFDEGKLFLGGVRGGSQGIHVYNISNLSNIQRSLYIPGIDVRWDDQFSCPVGNMVIVSDDQKVDNHYVGAKIAVHSAVKNTKGPTVMYTNPAANAAKVSVNSSIGISFSDWIEFKSINKASFILRPAAGGNPIPGTWSWVYTTVTFTPDQPLDLNTKYEVVLSGITDLVGNPMASPYKYTFTTGVNTSVAYTSPAVTGNAPAQKGAAVKWTVSNPASNITYEWTKEGEVFATGTSGSPGFSDIGRYQGCVRVYEKTNVIGLKTYEAESGYFSSGAGSFGSANKGYTGTGYADFSNSTGSSIYLEWQVESLSAAVANLRFRYANGGAANRPLRLIVNGAAVNTFDFASTTSWTAYNTTPYFNGVNLRKGINVIRLVASANIAGGNIDNLQVDIKNRISNEGEAEAGTGNGGVKPVATHAGYSGTGYMDFPDAAQGTNVNITWTVTNSTTAATKLTFRYANGSTANRPLNIRVNGGSPVVVNFPPTGSWTTWKTVTTGNITLNAGRSTVVLSADAGTTGSNIDHVSHATTEGVLGRLLENKCFMQVIYENTTVQPKSSSPLAKLGTAIWNVNPDAGTVSAINATTYAKLYEVQVGTTPKSIAAVGTNLWVVNRDSWNISVINSTNGTVSKTIALPYSSQPNSILVSHDGNFAYVTLQALGKVAKIATSTGSITATASLGNGSYENVAQTGAMALDATGQKLLVCRFISEDNKEGTVYELNPATMAVTKTVSMLSTNTTDASNASRGIPNYLNGITISPSGKEAWVASKKDNIERGGFRDGLFLEHETTVRAITSRIDVGTMTDQLAKRIDIDNSDRCHSVTFNAYGDLAFITLPGNNKVAVIETKTGSKITEFLVGKVPDAALFDQDSKKLYVHNFLSRSISVVDVTKLLDGSGVEQFLKEVVVVQKEPLTAQVLLGKQLFYDASSQKLNQNGYMSCASCHLDGGHDGQTWDFTSLGEGFRNTIDLRGKAGTRHGMIHWTANFDEIHDFENQIRDLGAGSGLMDDVAFTATRAPFGPSKAGYSGDLDALAAYVASLDKEPHSPYRNSNGSLTANGLKGRVVFLENNCQACHAGSVFTDSPTRQRHDIGTIRNSSGSRMGGVLDGFDTPSLLGAWNSAPYLHDGSAPTIKDAILQHRNLTLTGDLDMLVDYIRQLDDHADDNSIRIGAESQQIINIREIAVYPNPVLDKMMISGAESGDQIVIYDSHGMAVGQHTVTRDQLIDVTGLSSGVYTIIIKGKGSAKWVKN